jgi:dTDP-4-amino-4,6-dideoxygalactose transaminase
VWKFLIENLVEKVMRVQLLDLKEQYKGIRVEIHQAIEDLVVRQEFILGPEVDTFEKQMADYCGVRRAVGVSSGTDALLLALMALDISPGDEVVTTPFTFFATAGVVSRLGAKPVFADIESSTFNIDPAKVEEVVTTKSKAIIPVHVFGRCASMGPLLDLAKEQGLFLVEDAAQAIGATVSNGKAGAIGDAGCFSFFPAKNLGAFGDAGMVVTQDEELGERLRKMRVHGSSEKYRYEMVGGNFRIDTLQAAILSVKLKYLDEWVERRLENARAYNYLFQEAGLLVENIVVPEIPENSHVFHQYVIRAHERDALRAFMGERDISTGVYYPLPLHLQPCFRDLGYKEGDFPESEKACREVLALPIYPELTRQAQEYVVLAIQDFYKQKNS